VKNTVLLTLTFGVFQDEFANFCLKFEWAVNSFLSSHVDQTEIIHHVLHASKRTWCDHVKKKKIVSLNQIGSSIQSRLFFVALR